MLTERDDMTRGRGVGIVLLCIVLWSPSGAQAQDPQPEGPPPPPITSRRPYRALFGDARAEPELTRGVDFTGSVSRVYDENLLAELVGVSPGTAFGPSGAYTNFVGDLRFVRRGSRLQVAGTGGVNARYYGNLADFTSSDYHVGFGLSAGVSPLTTVAVSQALSNSPIFLLGLFATGEPPLLGEPRPPATDYAVTNDRAVSANSSVEVERRLSARALVSATGGYRRSHYLAAGPNGSDFSSVDGGGLYRYRIREDSDLQFGYTYRRARYPGAGPVITGPQPDEHVVLAGLGFHPMSSESRRTVLNFQVGTSLVHLPVTTSTFSTGWQVRVIGDASVVHQLGPTWQLVGAFERSTAFVEGLSAPVFTDAYSISTNGYINDRTDLLASLAYSNGEPSLVSVALSTFSTTTATARVRVALSSRWAFTSEYLFYSYDFGQIPQLVPGLSPLVKRNSVRAGLALWVPLHRP